MQKTGHYKMPNPWGFVESAKEAIENGGDNYIGFSWFGEKEDPIVGQTKAYSCSECQTLIIDSIKKINKIRDREERKLILDELIDKAKKLECKHYDEFQKELSEKEKNNKRKTPERRLHDYYADIINNQTGAEIEHADEPEL